MAKILVIEDDLDVSNSIKSGLSRERHVVDCSGTGQLGLELFYRFPYDLVILDWNLPDMEGPEICKALRLAKHDIAVLFLTSRSEVADRITGLDAGAFDYVVKPSTLEEIAARVRSLLRRVNAMQPASLDLADLQFHPAALEIRCGGRNILLSQSESDILNLLLQNQDTTFSSQQIMENLWKGKPGSRQLVKVHVLNLRKKLTDLNTCVELVTSKSGGYGLKVNSLRDNSTLPE